MESEGADRVVVETTPTRVYPPACSPDYGAPQAHYGESDVCSTPPTAPRLITNPPLTSLPLSLIPDCSSNQLERALERLDCKSKPRRSGSHVTYSRIDPATNKECFATVVLGKRTLDKRIIRSVLQELQISLSDFQGALR